jgi:hypothetical protein
MARTRSRVPLLTQWNPATRQKRYHRILDGIREAIATLALSPVDDGHFPHVTQLPMDGIVNLVDQDVTLTGENFIQDHVQSTGTSDTGTNAGLDWAAVVPGVSGDDITITMDDDVAHAAGPFITAAGNDVTVGYDSVGAGHDATDVVASTADPDLNTSGRVTCALEAGSTGAVAPTDAAEVELTGGSGIGDFTLEPAGILIRLMSWTATSIVARLDLSGYGDGDVVELLVICDGIEHAINLLVSAAAAGTKAGRGGVGYIDVTGATDGVGPPPESFIIGTETWTFQAGAAAALGEVQEGAGAVAAAANIVTAINAFSELVTAHVVAGGGAGSTLVALVPLATGVAGNYALDAALTANMTDQDMQGGAADAFEGGYPLSYVISAADIVHWAAGRYVPVACYPFTDQPELISMLFVRPGAGFDEIGSAFTTRARWVQSDTNFWVLEILDPAPADFQALDELRIVVGQ